jgi:hypothetical protein
MPNIPSEPNHRARVRSFLFRGTESYKMRRVVEIAPTLLHLSVFFFFGGLAIVFHSIHKKVAIAVDVAVGFFGLAYIVLSILPCRDVKCPYRTPMTYILWYPWHAFPGFAAYCFSWVLERVYDLERVFPTILDNPMTSTQLTLIRWLESAENTYKTHWGYIKDRLGKSIINRAMDAQGDEDRKILTGLFSQLALGDKSKLQKFAASIPRYRTPDLIPLIDTRRNVLQLQEPITILLQSYAAGKRVAGPDEDVRKRSLLVCLDAIHGIVKAPNVPDLDAVRAKFADISLMEALWNDSDTTIRITSCSICALLARQVMRETPLSALQLRWLRDIIGEAPDTIYAADFVKRDHMNLKSFVYRVLSKQVVGEDATSFKETLANLLDVIDDADFDTNNSQNRLSEEVRWIQEADPQGSHEVVAKLYAMFPFLLPTLPPP